MPKGETDLYERPRAVAQEMLKPDRHLDRPLDSTERNLVSTNAAWSGLLSSLGTGVVSGALVAAANTFSPRFRGALGVSGKTALIVTPTLGAFAFSSQISINGVTKDGGGSIGAATAAAPAATVSSLPLWCRAANQLYESPFKTIMAICAPAYGALFYHESTSPATANMLLSQRLIHTRVYGQAIVVCTTAAVFMFSKSMEAEGAYTVMEGKVQRQADLAKHQKMRHWYSDLGKEKVHADGSPDIGVEPVPSFAGKEFNADLFMPLIYVPLIPLVVVGLRGRVAPVTLQRISMGLIGSGLAHAGSIMFTDSSVTTHG
jgi:hypothetical protein